MAEAPKTPSMQPGMPMFRPPAGAGGPFVPRDRTGSADAGFFALDRDGDGLISFEEMTDNLRAERDRWDANGDGQIDLEEWRDYIKAFSERNRRVPQDTGTRPPIGGVKEASPAKTAGPITLPKPKPHKNETVSRVPSPTSYLPPWLQPCDTDGDGQVALYEWKEKGGSVADFRQLDLDGDGFVTLAELIRAGYAEPGTGDKTAVLPDPGNLRAFRGQSNISHQFEVTGRLSGSVWGTDIYTDDSMVATAAVHAGVLQAGQTGVVKVTIVDGQASYSGSTRHGVTSANFGPWNSSFRIEAGRGRTSGR